MGECPNCGIEKKSPSTNWKVSWKCFEQEVIGMNEDGGPKKRVK
jgi:hypothetical protein